MNSASTGTLKTKQGCVSLGMLQNLVHLCAIFKPTLQNNTSGITGGGGQGAVCPPETSDWEFLLTYWERRGKEKREKG